MRYKCTDCKDKGFITLLTSNVPCDCKKALEVDARAAASSGRPHWVAGYDSYAAYVAAQHRPAG